MADKVIGFPESRRFTFLLDDGSKYSLPMTDNLSLKDARALAKAAKSKSNETLFDTLADIIIRECPGIDEKVSTKGLAEIVRMWGEASSVTVGE